MRDIYSTCVIEAKILMRQFLSLPGKGKPLDTDSGAITNSTEEEALMEMGKPRLGDVTKIKIYIKESQEFKVICHVVFFVRTAHIVISRFVSVPQEFLSLIYVPGSWCFKALLILLHSECPKNP